MPDHPTGSALSLEGFGSPGTDLSHMDILVLSPTPTAPTDQGNRKRVHAICSELKARGARIHFVHYPHEWWFNFAPMDLADEMRRQWDSFHLVPTTRSLHARAAGDDHTIDEWWDPAIGDYLKWLFSRQQFDAFIVNYTYLSKAFEFAPPEVLRILDTHDKFTGRRQLLESNGIPREFFYTTSDQEAIALDRAQMVWAIKEEEAEFFRSISKTPCITMPHVEPRRRIVRKPRDGDEGYLVLGMLGAQNAINVSNARQFVQEVLPIFKSRLAPIKVRLAGGMCGALADLADVPGVEVMGRVEAVEEFYEAIDVVTVPLAFSTGLKIKAVEAFASGMPIVAMGHALEGIPVEHPHHLCTSMREIAESCLELAYEPGLLDESRRATLHTYEQVEQQAETAFAITRRRMLERPRIVIPIGPAFFSKDSIYREHVVQSMHYLRHLGQLVLYCEEAPKLSQSALFEWFNGLATFGKICFSPEAGFPAGRSAGMMTIVAPLSDLLRDGSGVSAMLMDVPEALNDLPEDLAKRVNWVVRTDTLAVFCPERLGALQQWLGTAASSVTLVDSAGAPGALDALPGISEGTRVLQVPFWRWVPWQLGKELDATRVDLLVTEATAPVAATVASVIEGITEGRRCRLVVSTASGQDDASLLETLGRVQGREVVTLRHALASFSQLCRPALLVVNLGDSNASQMAIAVETVCRAGSGIVTREAANPLDLVSHPDDSVLSLLTRVAHFHAEPAAVMARRAQMWFANDAGWTHLWRQIASRNVLR